MKGRFNREKDKWIRPALLIIGLMFILIDETWTCYKLTDKIELESVYNGLVKVK